MDALLLVLLVFDAVLALVVGVMGELVRTRRLEEARRREAEQKRIEAVQKLLEAYRQKRIAGYE